MDTNVVGFELIEQSFIAFSSNIENVAQFGGTQDVASIKLFLDTSSNAVFFGVRNKAAPELFFQTASNIPPSIIIDNRGWVGIGTSYPQYPFDVRVPSNIGGGGGGGSNYGIPMVPQTSVIEEYDMMQRVQLFHGQVSITQPGTHQLGFLASWDNANATDDDLFQVDSFIYLYGTGGTRGYSRFSAFVNPTNNVGSNLPGMDAMLESVSMTGNGFSSFHPLIYRNGSNSAIIVTEWQSSVAAKGNVKMEVFSPLSLGNINLKPVYVPPSSIIELLGGTTVQYVKANYGQVMTSGIGNHEVGYVVGWTGAPEINEIFKAVIGFNASGAGGIRCYARTSTLVNPLDNGSTLPGLDVHAEKVTMYSTHFKNVSVNVVRTSSKSVKIFVAWTSYSNFQCNVDFKLDVYAPTSLGGFYVYPHVV